MIKHKHWHRLPSDPILKALPSMSWKPVNGSTAASETAALMLYVALNFMAEHSVRETGETVAIAAASYDDLEKATGLSRSLISQGLKRLIELELIQPEGSHQKRRYRISWTESTWFKLPCQAITTAGVILPFQSFTLRSKHELHAMKLYLYLAARRSNDKPYSMAAYETIFDRIRVPERDIKRAISHLINCGLLNSVARQHSEETQVNEPNKYFLAGHQQLIKTA